MRRRAGAEDEEGRRQHYSINARGALTCDRGRFGGGSVFFSLEPLRALMKNLARPHAAHAAHASR